ncbi:MAG: zinc metallopeptidase [Chloroflexi bacterium]|nr:zinc metallopeptidase [Chloroflexota bacterium]
MPFFFFNPYYFIFMLPALALMALAQWRVKGAYEKWSKVPNRMNLRGGDVAQRLLQTSTSLQFRNIGVEAIGPSVGAPRIEVLRGGALNDHYDPTSNTLRLSEGVAHGHSVASMAIVAHELGHAQQDAENYFPLKLRAALVPAVNIGSNLGWILILIGLFLQIAQVAWLGVLVFSAGAIFALATLPVEFDASYRARRLLTDAGLVTSDDEQRGVNGVLDAAAMTYVAGLATALFQLLYYVMLVGGIGGRRRR